MAGVRVRAPLHGALALTRFFILHTCNLFSALAETEQLSEELSPILPREEAGRAGPCTLPTHPTLPYPTSTYTTGHKVCTAWEPRVASQAVGSLICCAEIQGLGAEPLSTSVQQSIVPSLVCMLMRKQNTSFLFKILRVVGLGGIDTWFVFPFPLFLLVHAYECVCGCGC